MNHDFNEEEAFDQLRKDVDRLLWIMVKNDHASMGVDGSGEFIFWATEANTAKFKREQHLYYEET